jgi:Tat protein secretion system quality control protein TatD with DNase activity
MGGVVHSFTGSIAEAVEYQDMGFHLRFVWTSVSPAFCTMMTTFNQCEWLLLQDRR